jgi:tetratricopeptide (TPR) repeat protein
LRPGYGHAYWALANLKTFHFSDDDLAAMREQLARSAPKAESGDPAIALEFALGAALEMRGQYAESFARVERGNALYRARIEYDPEVTTAYTKDSRALFTRDFFAAREGWGSLRKDPIFIVGLPRSGSTLLEQILSSHPEVEGTRELNEVPLIAQELDALRESADRIEYPRRLGMLAREQIENLAERYLSRTGAQRPRGLGRFVDKMLGNFSHLGLIHLMFPNASIIDARRHPMACAFSCFKQRFSRGMNFSYEQSELGRYYRDYASLLAHMDEVLPGRIYRIYYERLVADPENEVRRLLGHLGLPWNSACLRFYENRRLVQTISSEQVRQPLYADAVDQWRRFETWLEPLREELGELVAKYPAS